MKKIVLLNKSFKTNFLIFALLILTMIFLVSCNNEEETNITIIDKPKTSQTAEVIKRIDEPTAKEEDLKRERELNESKVEETVEESEETQSKELTENDMQALLKVMPEFNKVIYSKAYLYKFSYSEMQNAVIEFINVLANKQFKSDEANIVRLNYSLLESCAQVDIKLNLDAYNTLKQTDYYDYIKEEYMVDNNGKNVSAISFNLGNYEEMPLYYTFETKIYKPVFIEKTSVDSMKIDDKIMVTFPNKKGKENVILNYDGAKTFEYKVKDDEKEKECYVVDYDDKYYIFYDEDEKRIETEEKNMKLRVLKNANIGQGSSFMFIANEEDTYKKNLSDEKYYYDIETVIRNRDDNIFSNSLQFYASYVIFDNKGYITDLYDFTVE